MASINLSGVLIDPTGEFAVGDKIRFTHKSTTGETIQSAVSELTIGPTGAYNIDLEYGLVLVEYNDVRRRQYKNLGVATVNQDNPATSIPELLNALVPVSSPELIEFQAILADCVTAETNAAASAAAALVSETNANSSAQSIDVDNLPFIFDTVALFKASLIEFPDGKTIHLKDRDADFTKITGTGTANTFNIIASTSVNQSIDLIVTAPLNIINLGAQTGGDDTRSVIEAALLISKNLYVPEGRWYMSDLTLSVPCIIKGDRPKANTGTLGTVFFAIDGVSDKMITLASEGITLKNFLCLNDFVATLTYMIGKDAAPTTAFHCELSNITCKGNAQTHFNLPYLWNSHLKMLRAESGATVGFNFDVGTSLVMDSLVAYSTLGNGFSVKSLVYSVMNGCGVDSCANGIDLISDNRGLTLNSFGSEGVAGYSVRVGGTGNAVTINSPYLDGTVATTDMVQVTSTSALTSVTINSLVTTGVSTPATAKFIDVVSLNPNVSVNDCYFSNLTRETSIAAGHIAVRGGNLDRSAEVTKRDVIATMATTEEVVILNVTNFAKETLLITADNSSGERFYDGKFYASFNAVHTIRTDNQSGIDLILSGNELKLQNQLGSSLANVSYTIQRLGPNIAS